MFVFIFFFLNQKSFSEIAPSMCRNKNSYVKKCFGKENFNLDYVGKVIPKEIYLEKSISESLRLIAAEIRKVFLNLGFEFGETSVIPC